MANTTSNLTADTSNKVEVSKKKPNNKLKSSKVDDAISRSKTMTGSRPDEININPVQEEVEKKAVFAFGRFNPPTIGHEKLIHKVEDTAKSQGAEAHVIASHSEGTDKNPVPSSAKANYIKKVAAKNTHVASSSPEHPSLLHHLTKLHNAGVQHLTMVAGSDRVDQYHQLINKYNDKKSSHGYYNFKSVKVVSAGHRDPDAEGTEGMSGSKMRELARAGKHQEFKKGLPKALHSSAKEIIDHINSVKEDVNYLFDQQFINLDDNDQVITAIARVWEDFDFFTEEEKKKKTNTHYITVAARYGKAGNNQHYIDQSTVTKVDHKINFKQDINKGSSHQSVPSMKKAEEYVKNTPQHSSMVAKGYHLLSVGHKSGSVIVKKINEEFNNMFEQREAIPRSGQKRKDIDLVPRDDADRKVSDKPYRLQSIMKKIVDEAKKSPWERMLAKNPKHAESEARAQDAKAGLEKAGKDYQAILDREAAAKKLNKEERGLWDNIHAKRKRIKAGSGERMRKPGSEGAPTPKDLKDSQ